MPPICLHIVVFRGKIFYDATMLPVCTPLEFWLNSQIFSKFGLNIMPLKATPVSHFLISYNQ
jgi:hypothetical protein